MISSWEPGTWPAPHVLYGGDYNPEQWPPPVWARGRRADARAGVNTATVGVFSWARWSPRRAGTTSAGWTTCSTCCTRAASASSSPPRPPRRRRGSRPRTPTRCRSTPTARGCAHGSRTLTACAPGVPGGRAAIAAELAGRLRRSPGAPDVARAQRVRLHVPSASATTSAAAFRVWLRDRYGTLEALNEAWWTTFWSQRYRDWDEVLPPRRDPALPNPGQSLDFRRFFSDEMLGRYRRARDLRSARGLARVPVTTNYMGYLKPLDYGAWARGASTCLRSTTTSTAGRRRTAATSRRRGPHRSSAGGRPWLLMEQSTTPRRPAAGELAKVPGEMRGAAARPWPGARPGSCSSSGGPRRRARRSSTARCSVTPGRPPRPGGR